MKLWQLQDNALFLQNWRERMRASSLFSAIVLTILIIILIIVNATLNETYEYIYQPGSSDQYQSLKMYIPWYRKIFLDFAVLQGVIILLFGTMAAYRMAARERTSSTLDFHRASPTPRRVQVLGLLFGATSLEWCLTLAIFLIEFVIIFVTPIAAKPYLQFFIALALCSLLYHTVAILMGLSTTPNRQKSNALQMIIITYVALQMFAVKLLSFTYHLSWVPAYEQLGWAVKGFRSDDRYWGSAHEAAYEFFGYPVNSLLFQCVVQIPFFVLLLAAIARKISHYEKPIFSKDHSLLMIFYILFLFTGSSISTILSNAFTYYTKMEFGLYLYVLLFVSMVGAFLATPNRLEYIKGWRRTKKIHKKLNALDDAASTAAWLSALSIIMAVSFVLQSYYFIFPCHIKLTAFTICLAYTVAFAGTYEYFNLSRHYKKKLVFWTLLIVVWVLLPVLGYIVESFDSDSVLLTYLFSPSPFMGGLPIINGTLSTCGSIDCDPKNYSQLQIVLYISSVMAIAGLFIAYVQRQKAVRETNQ